MSVIEDVRKVVQDLVAPELKSISVKLDGLDRESKLRDEGLVAKLDSLDRESKLRDEGLVAKLDSSDRESKLRDENLANDAKVRGELTQLKLDALSAKMDGVTAKMDFQYASIMNALDLNRRVETLERDKQAASA
jgi:hypothetical protein